MKLRNVVLRAALFSLAFSLTYAAHGFAEQAVVSSVDDDPAFAAMLGSGAPADRVSALGGMLRAQPAAGNLVGSGPSFFSALRDTGSPGSPKFEASGVVFDLRFGGYEALRFENARVALMPAADGRTCRFEVSGSPFGPASKLEASGTVEWKAGPAGGDKLDIEFRLDDASVEAIRAWAPTRMDPSFGGLLDVRGKGTGVVGERTTEEAPATPLKGDFEATLDWTAFGQTSPMTIRSQFATDDRMTRLIGGRMTWREEGLDLKGWVKPGREDNFELVAGFANVDTAAVAARWNVAPPWQVASTLSGAITLKGTPGKGLLRYEARAPLITLPALGGYDVRAEDAHLVGSLVAINADIAVSLRAKSIVVGGIDLGSLPVGIRWWESKVVVTNSNSKLYEGENDGTFVYEPAKHPEVRLHGRVKNGKAPLLVQNLAPWSGLDLDGNGSVAFLVGQDQQRSPFFSFHGSLTQGRLGGTDLFGSTLAALAKADPALQLPADTVPAPRSGTGTRVDRWFFEADRKNDVYEIGGLFLMAGEFRLDGDGQFTRAGGLKLDGTVSFPVGVAAQLQGAAPWIAALRRGDSLFVPVTVSGPLASLKLELAAGYADLLAKAKRGEAVEAPGIREVRHVGPEGLAVIPVDPANEMLQ